MKLVIYRNKQTNKIYSYHEVTAQCTPEAIADYNGNSEVGLKAEIVELDDVAEYFYMLKTSTIEDEAENLRDLKDAISRIADRIDDRLSEFDIWLNAERGQNE